MFIYDYVLYGYDSCLHSLPLTSPKFPSDEPVSSSQNPIDINYIMLILYCLVDKGSLNGVGRCLIRGGKEIPTYEDIKKKESCDHHTMYHGNPQLSFLGVLTHFEGLKPSFFMGTWGARVWNEEMNQTFPFSL